MLELQGSRRLSEKMSGVPSLDNADLTQFAEVPPQNLLGFMVPLLLGASLELAVRTSRPRRGQTP